MQKEQVYVVASHATELDQDTQLCATSEQRSYLGKLITAMAEKFKVEPENFSQVEVRAGNGRNIMAVYMAPEGLYKKSWKDIFASAEDFIVNVDGNLVDTRQGMTQSVYEAMVATANTRGNTIPDSVTHWTWMSGEKPDSTLAPVAYTLQSNDNQPVLSWVDHGSADKDVRFRPATGILIEEAKE